MKATKVTRTNLSLMGRDKDDDDPIIYKSTLTPSNHGWDPPPSARIIPIWCLAALWSSNRSLVTSLLSSSRRSGYFGTVSWDIVKQVPCKSNFCTSWTLKMLLRLNENPLYPKPRTQMDLLILPENPPNSFCWEQSPSFCLVVYPSKHLPHNHKSLDQEKPFPASCVQG